MKHRIERIKVITREYIRANPDKIFLFGDNLERRGYGGQAAAMRGESNAIGIPTKNSPSNKDDAYFSDEEFDQNKTAIDAAFAEVTRATANSSRVIVIPADGLGTGRAQLGRRAPRTFAYLQQQLAEFVSPKR